MRNFKDIILEKLKISKKTLSDDGNTIEVPYYEFVIWYIGFSKKPDEITEKDLRISGFADAIVDSKGIEVFANARLAHDFYKSNKDEIVTITIEKQRGPAGDDDSFLNIIDFGDEVFYVDSYEDFIEYIQYNQEIRNK
jgi:hypothetical protein